MNRQDSPPGLRLLASGLAMGESPRWHDGRLWVCDWMARRLLAFDAEGRREEVASIESLPFCVDFTSAGELLIASSSDRKVLRRSAEGSLAVHADLALLSDKPWNEIVAGPGGNAYVNNIGFDFPDGEVQPGFVALVRPDGSADCVADGLEFPNGMVVTSDGRTLIVAESYGRRLTAFGIDPDCGLSGRRVWAEVDGHPDGICLDADGAVWWADVGTRRCERVREGGEVLQTVQLDRGCFSCALGGEDGRTLFIVANAWGGPAAMGDSATGQVWSLPAPARAAARPV